MPGVVYEPAGTRKQRFRSEAGGELHDFHRLAGDDQPLAAEHLIDRIGCDLDARQRRHAKMHIGRCAKLRVDWTGTERADIDGTLAAAQLLANRLRQAQDIRFCRVVAGHAGTRHKTGHRGHIENITAVPCDQIAQEQFGQYMHGADVCIDHPQLRIELRFAEGAELAEPGVVDKQVDAFAARFIVQSFAAAGV